MIEGGLRVSEISEGATLRQHNHATSCTISCVVMPGIIIFRGEEPAFVKALNETERAAMKGSRSQWNIFFNRDDIAGQFKRIEQIRQWHYL